MSPALVVLLAALGDAASQGQAGRPAGEGGGREGSGCSALQGSLRRRVPVRMLVVAARHQLVGHRHPECKTCLRGWCLRGWRDAFRPSPMRWFTSMHLTLPGQHAPERRSRGACSASVTAAGAAQAACSRRRGRGCWPTPTVRQATASIKRFEQNFEMSRVACGALLD